MLAASMLLAVAACARTPPEQALRNAMSALQAAVEHRDATAVRSMLADDFIGPEGIDRDGAQRMAQGMFLRYRDVGARLGRLDIALQGNGPAARHARVKFDAVVTGGGAGLLPESGQLYEVETGWRLEDGEWRMVSAQWRPRVGTGQ